MTKLCAPCAAGNHSHDTYPDGSDAGCPNLAQNHEHPNDGCCCPAVVPVRIAGTHTCTCGHVHVPVRR
jgi:hypothetical protein